MHAAYSTTLDQVMAQGFILVSLPIAPTAALPSRPRRRMIGGSQ
jgi:hypothetical protein